MFHDINALKIQNITNLNLCVDDVRWKGGT